MPLFCYMDSECLVPCLFKFSEPYVTEDELKLMLRGAELSGAIEEEEQVIINISYCISSYVRL